MVSVVEEFGFWQYFDKTVPNKKGYKVYGSSNPNHAGNYTTRSNRNIVDAYNKDLGWRSQEVLELMGLINKAYHMQDREEFDDLIVIANQRFSSQSKEALGIYNW